MTEAERANAASDKAELKTARSEQVQTRRRIIWTGLAVFLSVVVSIGALLQYVSYVNNKNDERWCQLLVTLDTAYTANQPTTPVGISIANAIHLLRIELHCSQEQEVK